MADPARAAKMADRIKVIIAKTLERGLKDPRLGFVTITDVKVTGDLQHASIFYTVYGSDEECTWAPIAQGIEHCPPEAGAAVRICLGAPYENVGQVGRADPDTTGESPSWQHFGNTY